VIGRVVLLAAILVLAAPGEPAAEESGTVVVGSKNFSENRLLGEMFAQLIEARTDLRAVRRLGLAGTRICFQALQTGAIDVYPEYSGTGLVTLLGEKPSGDARETLNRVRSEFLARWNLWWLSPLGFENAYEIAVPRALAEREHLRTIGDLVPLAPSLTAGFGYEFIEREDGLPGLRALYGLSFRDVKAMQQALKYRAAGAGDIQCLDVYTTDGRLLVNDLQVLEDDRGFFPPYEAAALVRGDALREHPEIGPVLGLLAGALDEAAMRRLNLRIEEKGEAVETVAGDALAQLGLVGAAAPSEPRPRTRNPLARLASNPKELGRRTLEHLGLSATALLLGILVAVPLGLVLERRRKAAESVIRMVGVSQTIPSIALLAFMIPLFGVGVLPAAVALWIYSIFPILRNTYSGLRDAGPEAVGAARALGMTDAQILRSVRLPLAAPVIMAGIRTSAVITVGTATLAAFIGAGGLGVPIVSGLQMNDTGMILSGAVPAAALALVVDGLLALVERRLTPPGLNLHG